MSYGTAIAQALPAVLSAEPTAASALRAWCDEVETRLEAKVTPAGFLANADLDLATTYGLNNAQHINLAAASATKTGGSHARKLYAYNGELYYTNTSGTTVRLTNAGAIDVASIRGILGDYSADGNCQIDYTTATTLYRMLSNLSNLARAVVEVGTLRVYGTANNPSYRVTVAVPSLSASYSFTLPTAVPGSTSLLEWTIGGQLQSTRGPTLDSLTLVSNGNITLAGTGKVLHGDRKLVFPVLQQFHNDVGSWSTVYDTNGGYILAGAGGDSCVVFLTHLPVGARLRYITVCHRNGSTTVPTIVLYRLSPTSRTEIIADSDFSHTAASGEQIVTNNTAANHTILEGNTYAVHFTSSHTDDRLANITVTYDQAA